MALGKNADVRLLIVDDEEAQYRLVSAYLQEDPETRFAVDWAPSFEAARQQILEGEHDAYLIDEYLGSERGSELVRQMRTQGVEKPMLLTSGLESRELARQAMEVGAADFLVKGVGGAELLARSILRSLDQRRTLETLLRAGQKDDLTGLVGRRVFRQELARACQNAAQSTRRAGLLYVDIDKFKQINDTWGHEAGDAVLLEVVERLRHAVRSSDLVARLGGDEFGILLRELDDVDSLWEMAARVHDSFGSRVSYGGLAFEVSASIGGACFPEHGQAPDALLRAADTAMYRGKRGGRAGISIYDADVTPADSGPGRADTRSVLDRLRLWYQPLVDLRSGTLFSAEALLRIDGAAAAVSSPETLFPEFRRAGIQDEVEHWVLETALQDFGRAQGLRAGVDRICVNLSQRMLLEPTLVPDISELMHRVGIHPWQIVLEFPEKAFLHGSADTGEQLQRLHDLGCVVAMDGFGRAAWRFSDLARLPMDRVKLAAPFVREAASDTCLRRLLRSLVGLLREAGVEVWAAGVESEAMATFLGEVDCRIAQGYRWVPPAPLRELQKWISHYCSTSQAA